MNGRLLGIGEAITLGWETFKKQAGIVIGGYLLYMVIAAICGAIPFVNFVLLLFALPPLVGGLYVLILNATKGTNPTINDLFSGFNQYGKWLGVYWLFMLATLIAYIPGGILIGIATLLANKGQQATSTTTTTFQPGVAAMGAGAIALIVIGSIISVILIFVVFLRYIFAYFLAAEGASPVAAFKASAAMTEGHRGGLLWMLIVLWLLAIAGAVACGIGIFVTAPVAWLALTHVYLAMKPQAAAPAEPAAPTPPPAPEPLPPPPPAEPEAPAEPEVKPETTEESSEKSE